MKKGKIACLGLVACLAVPCLMISGCSGSEGLYVTKNTPYLQLADKLSQKNYSVVWQQIENSSNEITQIGAYYDGHVSLDITFEPYEGKTLITKVYTFLNFEREQLVEYKVGVANYTLGDSNQIVIGAEKVVEAEKVYAENSSRVLNVGNFALLENQNGTLGLKDYASTSLEFINGEIITTETLAGGVIKTVLSDIGTTEIKLPKEVVSAAKYASWAEEVVCQDVRYEMTADGYKAILEDGAYSYWDNHTSANIPQSVNGVKVVGVVQDSTKTNYSGRTIYVDNDSANKMFAGTFDGFTYDFENFVERGGAVIFKDVVLQKGFIAPSTSLEELQTMVAGNNYTISLNKVYFTEGVRTEVVETTTYSGREYVKKTTETTENVVKITEEYGIWVGGVYYMIQYTNYDYEGVIYPDGSMHCNYCAREDFDLQVHYGQNFLSKLESVEGALSIKQDAFNDIYSDLIFESGDIRIVNMFAPETGAPADNFGTEEARLYNVGVSGFVTPDYIIEKVLEQDPSNPLNAQNP